MPWSQKATYAANGRRAASVTLSSDPKNERALFGDGLCLVLCSSRSSATKALRYPYSFSGVELDVNHRGCAGSAQSRAVAPISRRVGGLAPITAVTSVRYADIVGSLMTCPAPTPDEPICDSTLASWSLGRAGTKRRRTAACAQTQSTKCVAFVTAPHGHCVAFTVTY